MKHEIPKCFDNFYDKDLVWKTYDLDGNVVKEERFRLKKKKKWQRIMCEAAVAWGVAGLLFLAIVVVILRAE